MNLRNFCLEVIRVHITAFVGERLDTQDTARRISF
jgi:hypothetical protein